MNRIDQRFSELKQQGRKALIPYITASGTSVHRGLHACAR